jgi:hypothetical protein
VFCLEHFPQKAVSFNLLLSQAHVSESSYAATSLLSEFEIDAGHLIPNVESITDLI